MERKSQTPIVHELKTGAKVTFLMIAPVVEVLAKYGARRARSAYLNKKYGPGRRIS